LIISKFNDNNGPDILGIWQVENEYVIQLFITVINSILNRQYAFVISKGKNKRGTDTALICDTAKYGPE